MTIADAYIESLELMGMRFGLERMTALLARIGNPEREFDAIHIVGTNGKTSTTLMAQALLLGDGYSVGAYTSPHISTFRERIRIGPEEISSDAYESAVNAVRDAGGLDVTQFEALTAVALLAFARAGVDWAVIEAGLGGRLDATNVLPRAKVVVLTNVDLEHTELLGDTREAIAAEKLAVVRPGAILVVGEPEWTSSAASRVLTVADDDGGYQDQNRAVALAAVEAALGRLVSPAPLSAVTVPGRLEIRGSRPIEVWDGAHNPSGMRRLAAELPALLGRRHVVAVFSCLRDKDVRLMIDTLRTVAPRIVATQSANTRALPAAELAKLTGGMSFDDPVVARAAGLDLAGRSGALVVCGSLYLLHDLAQRLS